jgi:hypothetical protein
MTHGIESGFEPIGDLDEFRAHLAFVHGQRHALWIDTFVNVARYRAEAQQSKLNIEDVERDCVRISLTCPLDSKTFDVPVTIVIVTTEAAREASANFEQTSEQIPTKLRESRKILIDLIPNGRAVLLRWR